MSSAGRRQMAGGYGFTLIELMVTMAIVAILAIVAYPSYLNSIAKSHRAEARAALMELVQYMEQQATRSGRYDQDENGVATVLPYTAVPKGQVVSLYIVGLTGLTAGSYTLNAVPQPNTMMAGDGCGTLSINSLGQKSLTNATLQLSQCW